MSNEFKLSDDQMKVIKEKNRKEISLIADYEMEYGQPWTWDDEIVKEFDQKWFEIQISFNII